MRDERIRILVVDDDPALLDMLREYLESPGDRYVVETATRGSEALEMIARARPHVVILDVEMPGMSGVQVLASLRALDPTIPVIMLTANTDRSVAAETLKLGALSYVPKAPRPSIPRSPRCDVRDDASRGARLIRLERSGAGPEPTLGDTLAPPYDHPIGPRKRKGAAKSAAYSGND